MVLLVEESLGEEAESRLEVDTEKVLVCLLRMLRSLHHNKIETYSIWNKNTRDRNRCCIYNKRRLQVSGEIYL